MYREKKLIHVIEPFDVRAFLRHPTTFSPFSSTVHLLLTSSQQRKNKSFQTRKGVGSAGESRASAWLPSFLMGLGFEGKFDGELESVGSGWVR